jgi:dTMP kinase
MASKMSRSQYSGIFLTFEGGEGAGKSTQIQLLAQGLQAAGYEVLLTRQPGGTGYGKRIRDLILAPAEEEVLSPRAELFLYLADRAHHVDYLVRPALQAGKVVICDRYTDSTLAYQGYGRGLDLEQLNLLNNAATGGLIPQLTFWLDLDPEVGRQRIVGRGVLDRLESEALHFHQAVQAGYAHLADQSPHRWLKVDALQSVSDIQAFILEQALRLLRTSVRFS